MTDTSLALVVAVHDVEPWLRECLASVAREAPAGTQVVLVDDGSTDGSGRICDEFAAERPDWTVLHQRNVGLGAARNAGLDMTRATYVGFVDGDDELLPAYAEMLELALAEGLDLVTGAVLRTDGTRSWPSGLHARALEGLGRTASLAEDRGLVYDTTAWNKVYRRSFLVDHGLRFPEGVLYEDIPLTIPAAHLAGRVGIVHDPVYSWRARTVGLSITQRRFELQNLVDRRKAVASVDAFLEARGLTEVRAAHDDKVLNIDLPLYTAALPEADEAYRQEYLAFIDALAPSLDPLRLASLPPTLRLYVELARRGRLDDLVRAVRGRRGPRPWAVDDRGLVHKIRDDWAVYGLERELQLASRSQVARRATVRVARLAAREAGLRSWVGRIPRRRGR
ncbi:hypothetical protein GCM10027517_02080 [Phycicoccus ginsengisoli]